MEPFFWFVLFTAIVAGAAWFLFALRGERRDRLRNNAAATALASRIVCPSCNLPTLQWSREIWDAELQYLDGTSKTEHGFTFFCVNCSQLYDFTDSGDFREASIND